MAILVGVTGLWAFSFSLIGVYLSGQVDAALSFVEETVGAKFGDPDNPLLVSVRSGARVSMPGMMDTVLNLGLNHITVEGLGSDDAQ